MVSAPEPESSPHSGSRETSHMIDWATLWSSLMYRTGVPLDLPRSSLPPHLPSFLSYWLAVKPLNTSSGSTACWKTNKLANCKALPLGKTRRQENKEKEQQSSQESILLRQKELTGNNYNQRWQKYLHTVLTVSKNTDIWIKKILKNVFVFFCR